MVLMHQLVEEKLTAIWTAALKRSQIGIYDNFFLIGGHSLLATRVILRIRGQFKVDLRLNNFFERPTIAGLAEYIETMLWATQNRPASRQVESRDRDEGII